MSYCRQGERWKEFRTKVNQIMLQPKIVKLYREALADVADDMIKRYRSWTIMKYLRNKTLMYRNIIQDHKPFVYQR